jgi:hypothetical protein
MVPHTALQVTAVFVLLPLTAAVNDCWPLRLTDVFWGLTETLSFEVIVTVAEPDTIRFWRLVAVIVTVGFEGKTPGALYLPD